MTKTTHQMRLHLIDSCDAAQAFEAMYCNSGKFNIGNDLLFSTHYSVVDYFAASGKTCRDVSADTDDEVLRNGLIQTNIQMRDLLHQLDNEISPQLCSVLQLPNMPILDLHYRYHASQHLMGAKLLAEWVARQATAYAEVELHFWCSQPTATHPIFLYSELLSDEAQRNGIEFFLHLSSAASSVREKRIKQIQRALLTPIKSIKKILSRLKETQKVNLRKADRLAILFQPEKNLRKELAKHVDTVLVWPREGARPIKGISPAARTCWNEAQLIIDRKLASLSPSENQVPPYSATDLQKRILVDLRNRLQLLLAPAVSMAKLSAQYNLTLGLWTVPTIATSARLAVEVLMRAGVPVVGMQHGGCYYLQHFGEKHFLLDFTACTHHFSYASSQVEMDKTYPQEERVAYCTLRECCRVIPVGNLDHMEIKKGSKPVDVVFPITNAMAIFSTCRTGAHHLAQAQRAIVDALEARTDLTSIVKPFPYASRDTIAITNHLAGLAHAKVIQQGWRDFLQTYAPQLIIIEYPSTPLLEALAYDTDIFVLCDPVSPFAPSALMLLKKRVHVFNSANELASAIASYSPNASPHLRDNEFYNKYVNTAPPLQNFHTAIDAILSQEGH